MAAKSLCGLFGEDGVDVAIRAPFESCDLDESRQDLEPPMECGWIVSIQRCGFQDIVISRPGVFDFDRRISGQRVRTRRRLPATWTRAQAEAFDRRETERLISQALGERQQWSIEQAVARYLTERVPALKHGKRQAQEMDLMAPWFEGRLLADLPQVCASYLADHRATLAPATIRNRLRYLTAACRWGWRTACG